MKCHPSEEVICIELAIVEWAKQPTYTIPYRMERCNTTLASIFEWWSADKLGLGQLS